MSRKIHHGANGSYKTSGALADDLMPAVTAGRPIVSNVRGLEDKELIIQAWYKLQPLSKRLFWKLRPDKIPLIDFDLYYLDTEDPHQGEENLEKMRRFSEWVPTGALIIFDEVDEIFDPQVFTASHIKKYDYPDVIDPETNEIIKTGKQASIEAGRLATLKTAFSKHRHMNWDMIFTCTSIDNVHPMIRKGADMAYRHFNMANVGAFAKGKYKEIAHSPDNKGSMESNAISTIIKKIPKPLFEIYKSTATGQVTDTVAGTSIWKGNRSLRIMTYITVALIIKSFWDVPYLLNKIGGGKVEETEKSEQVEEKTLDTNKKIITGNQAFVFNTAPLSDNNKNNDVSVSDGDYKIFDKTLSFINYFLPDKLFLVGRYDYSNTYFLNPENNITYNLDSFLSMGFSIEWVNKTTGFLIYKETVIPFFPKEQDIAEFCCLPDGNSAKGTKLVVNTPNNPFSKKK